MKALDKRNAEIFRRRSERQTIAQIATAMKMTPFAVRRICERNGVFKPPIAKSPKRPAPLSEIEMEAIRYRRARGETLESLRECFEVGKLTLRRVLDEGRASTGKKIPVSGLGITDCSGANGSSVSP